MTIPVQNIYYLLCYAWDKLEMKDMISVHSAEVKTLPELYARVLTSGVGRLLRQGPDMDYITTEGETRRIRGKILFGPSLSHGLLQNAAAFCSADELTDNILPNRILKATLKRLREMDLLDPSLRKEVNRVYRRFPAVEPMMPRPHHFFQARQERKSGNRMYDFLLDVCRLVWESVLIEEETGRFRFVDFVRDEVRMAHLFEAFVRNFYRREQNRYTVRRDTIAWHLDRNGDADHRLPHMETDISLTSETRKIVIETKFSAQPVSEQQGNIAPENLYQLFAYLKNLEGRGGLDETCEGILLYAAAGELIDSDFYLPKHRLRVKTLNLNQDWRGIHNELLELIQKDIP